MSSGEADVFYYRVTDTTGVDFTYYPTVDDNWWWKPVTTTSTYTWNNTVYLYQITCPRCGRLNWGEVDKIIVCKGETQARNNRKVACGARIKAVIEQVDYEIPVEAP